MSEEIKGIVSIYSDNNVAEAVGQDLATYDNLDLPDQATYGRDMIPLYHGMEKAIYTMGDTINELSVENNSFRDVLKSDPKKLEQAITLRNNRLLNQSNKEKSENIRKACRAAQSQRQLGAHVQPALIYSKMENPKSRKDVDKIKTIPNSFFN